MSLNLKAEEVDLYQTPTIITEMIWSRRDGDWSGILYRYQQWVKYNHNLTLNQCKNEEDAKLEEKIFQEHMKNIQKAVKKHKKLTFYVS